MRGPDRFQTDRLVLRKPTLGDANAIFALTPATNE